MKLLSVLYAILFTQILVSCTSIRHEGYRFGFGSADTSFLEEDEKRFFESNRSYLFRNEVSGWLSEPSRDKRNQIRSTLKFDSLIADRKAAELNEEKKIGAKKNEILNNKKIVTMSKELPSPYCDKKSERKNIIFSSYPVKDSLKIVSYEALKYSSNFAYVDVYMDSGLGVIFYKCPDYLVDHKIAKKNCLSGGKESPAGCSALISLMERSQLKPNEILLNVSEFSAFNKLSCSDLASMPGVCHTTVFQEARLKCENDNSGKKCLPYIRLLKGMMDYDSAITIAEIACEKGNSSGCSLLQSIQIEKQTKSSQDIELARKAQAEQDKKDQLYEEGLKDIEKAFSSPKKTKTKCESKRNFDGSYSTDCESEDD